jgi:hypothetical protein
MSYMTGSRPTSASVPRATCLPRDIQKPWDVTCVMSSTVLPGQGRPTPHPGLIGPPTGSGSDRQACRHDRALGGRSTVTRFSQVGRGLHTVSSALPSVQPGCSRQRVIELGEGRVGLPMLLREVGSSRDGRARPARA